MAARLTWWCERVNKEASPSSFSLIKQLASIRSPADNETQSEVSGGEARGVREGALNDTSVFLYSCHWIDNGTNHLWSRCRHTISNLGHWHALWASDGCLHEWTLTCLSSTFCTGSRQPYIHIYVLFCRGCSPTWPLTYILAQSGGSPLPWHRV